MLHMNISVFCENNSIMSSVALQQLFQFGENNPEMSSGSSRPCAFKFVMGSLHYKLIDVRVSRQKGSNERFIYIIY